MKKSDCAQVLALDLLDRSTCTVQVSAVIRDTFGIFSWGWNHAGQTGLGQHAEVHAIIRANRNRLKGATITVAGRRKKSGNPVCSFPCPDCFRLVHKFHIRTIEFQTKTGKWISVEVQDSDKLGKLI